MAKTKSTKQASKPDSEPTVTETVVELTAPAPKGYPLASLLLSGDTETVRRALVKQFNCPVDLALTVALIDMVRGLTGEGR